jgi:hypothetical protein
MGLSGSWRNINQKLPSLMASIGIAKLKRKIKFYNEELLTVKLCSKLIDCFFDSTGCSGYAGGMKDAET